MGLPLHILIADDSLLARMMLKKFVARLRPDWELYEAKDGSDALDKVNGKPVEVALLDYNMPGITGLDLAKKLKEQYPNIIAALITANVQDYIAKEATALGLEFINKPIDEDRILAFFRAKDI